jgi:dTDP-4-amino-4,6-dideoxygalactose transaminase
MTKRNKSGTSQLAAWPPGGGEAMLAAFDLGLAVEDGTGVIGQLEAAIRRHGLGRRYVLAQNSGTSALHAAYFGAGFSRGDEVLVPTIGFHGTTTALLAMQVTPIFLDVTEQGLPTIAAIESAWTPRTVGMVVTHMWGLAHDLAEVAACVDTLGGRLIEDCSHTLGATAGGRAAGRWGFAAASSLHATKPLATSEGGLLTTEDRGCYERALVLGHGGSRALREVTDPELAPLARSGLGWKHRISAPSAALGLAALQSFSDRLARRREGIRHFIEALGSEGLIGPAFDADAIDRSTWYRVPLRLAGDLAGRADEVARALRELDGPVITNSLMGSLSHIPVLQARSVAFPWLPEGWGCSPEAAAGALALEGSTVLLDPDIVAAEPQFAAAACHKVQGAWRW